MGKGFIYKIDTNENRLSDNIDVYRSVTTPIIFTGDKMKLGEFKEGDVFIYSDEDMDAWSGKFVVKSQCAGEITGMRVQKMMLEISKALGDTQSNRRNKKNKDCNRIIYADKKCPLGEGDHKYAEQWSISILCLQCREGCKCFAALLISTKVGRKKR